jgi:hypothetical protein
MKKRIFCKTVIFAGLVLFFSCSQDAIFYTISTEPAPVTPRIKGSPTNMVVFERFNNTIMYVASGSLHWYANKTGTPEWNLSESEYSIPQPEGKVIYLAATEKYLYALCIMGTGIETVLRRIGHDDNDWKVIENNDTTYTLIQTIFTDPSTDRLFAGVMMKNNGDDYGIFYLDDNASKPELISLRQGTKKLSGVAFKDNTYFLSTSGTGIYSVDDSLTVTQVSGGADKIFMGIIKLDNTIIAVERDGGAFFEVNKTELNQITYSNGEPVATGKYATGALWVWKQDNTDGGRKMLTAGIQGGLYTSSSSYTHGYVEFELDSASGSLDTSTSRRDNTPDITVDGYTDRYTATIGKHPINHFFQAPHEIDNNMTFFASTQTSGLWSYRKDRAGGPQWNAEN